MTNKGGRPKGTVKAASKKLHRVQISLTQEQQAYVTVQGGTKWIRQLVEIEMKKTFRPPHSLSRSK